MMKIGIIREGKNPPDSRVLFTPKQCVELKKKYNIDFVVQPSKVRCIADEFYKDEGIKLSEDLSDCDVLMGIKEVPKEQLIPNKKYFFFSHTIKEQAHNRALLQEILKKNITLYDYEVLTNQNLQRVIAFGRFAGVVGAHNGMMAYARKTDSFELKQMHEFKDFVNAIAHYKTIKFPKMKIVLTGTGRVANGAAETFDQMGIRKVSAQDFLNNSYEEAVYTQLDCADYAAPKDESKAFDLQDFFANPQNYKSIFEPYTKVADLMVNGIFWDSRAPIFFTKDDMKKSDFNIKVIADVTCDMAPSSSIPSTLLATTIDNPVFGYDPQNECATKPYQEGTIDMMTIDNLPNELPRDSSRAFGEQFIANVMEELLGLKNTGMLERATIAENGKLGKNFEYLQNYVSQLEASLV